LIAGSLFILGLISRIPFQSHYLYHWDSVNFALGTARFDVTAGQPHLPGYLLYIALGWVFNLVTHDPQVTFVTINILFSGLAVAIMFLLGQAVFDRRTGIIAALFLLVSPLFWFYGEVALPHVVDTFFVILVALLLYRAWHGENHYLIIAAAVLAIAAGFRPQTALFLAPLCLLAASRSKLKTVVLAVVTGTVLGLLWIIPLFSATGGIVTYLAATSTFSQSFHYWAPLQGLLKGQLAAFMSGTSKLIAYSVYGLGLTIFPLIIYAGLNLRRLKTPLFSAKSLFVLLWILPSVAFYAFVHMGQQGLVFVFLPALLLISAAALSGMWTGHRNPTLAKPGTFLGILATAAVVIIHTALFIVPSDHPLGANSLKILNWNTIQTSDAQKHEMLTAIQEHFSSKDTLLIGANWRHVGYYLPEYRLYRLPTITIQGEEVASMGLGDSVETISSDTLEIADGKGITLVFLDGDPSIIPTGFEKQSIALQTSQPLYYVYLKPHQQLSWQGNRLISIP
jgi:hypothetical protein